MIQLWDIIIIFGCAMIMSVVCMLLGAYIMFKGRNAVPGEGFLGGVPKGQVFTMPEADNIEDLPETDVLKNTEKFLNLFGR